MFDGKRVRAWLQDKSVNIIERSKTYILPTNVSLNITDGFTWVIYLVKGSGTMMDVLLMRWDTQQPNDYIEYIVLPFNVPIGTTDLNDIDIEVFTVKPGKLPVKGLFQR